jgi:hypothetical protein
MPLPLTAAPATLLAALGAAALALSGCGAALPEPSLRNIAQVQSALEQAVLAAENRHGTAYCPTDVPAIKGQVFSCVVEIPGGAPAIYRVTVETPQGFVSYIRTQ